MNKVVNKDSEYQCHCSVLYCTDPFVVVCFAFDKFDLKLSCVKVVK